MEGNPLKQTKDHDDEEETQAILVEMVYLAYRPVGMSFEQVKTLLKQVPDGTEHLQGLIFPQDGYAFPMEEGRTKKVCFEKGLALDHKTIGTIRGFP